MTDKTTQQWLDIAVDIIEATAHNDQHAIDFTLTPYDWHDLTELITAFGFLFLMTHGGTHVLTHTPKMRDRIAALPPDQ